MCTHNDATSTADAAAAPLDRRAFLRNSALFAVGVLVVRAHSKLYAFSLECPHRGRLLEWQPGGSQFYCPRHKAHFSTDGANIGGRRTGALDRYALRRDGAKVTVSLNRAFSATDAPAEWNAAALSV